MIVILELDLLINNNIKFQNWPYETRKVILTNFI